MASTPLPASSHMDNMLAWPRRTRGSTERSTVSTPKATRRASGSLAACFVVSLPAEKHTTSSSIQFFETVVKYDQTTSVDKLKCLCCLNKVDKKLAVKAIPKHKLIGVTIGRPGYFCLRRRTSSPVLDSAREHPARSSGISTILSGERIFEVSAMKCTPP